MLVSAMVLTVFSGCTGGGDEAGTDATDTILPPNPSAGNGAVEGTIFDAATELPIETGVMVAISTDPVQELRTGPDGYYAFSDLVPGTYRIEVGALRYAADAADVEVRADEITPQDFTLEPTQPEGVAHKVQVPAVPGRFYCGFAVNRTDLVEFMTVAGPCKAVYYDDPEHPFEVAWTTVTGGENNIFDFENIISGNRTVESDQIKSIVVELMWQPTSAAADNLQMSVEKFDDRAIDGGGPDTYALVSGPAPLKVEVRPGIEHPSAFNGPMPADATSFTVGVFPDTNTDPGAAAYLEQDFEVWITLFYNDYAPEDYSTFA